MTTTDPLTAGADRVTQPALPRVMEQQGVPPVITPETREFWDAAARGELVVERCQNCGLHIFPPRGVCRRCMGREMAWQTIDGRGILRSYTINHNAWAKDLEAIYGVGLVEFPDFSGVRFVGFLHGFDEEPEIDSPVSFQFVKAVTGIHRVYFRPWGSS